MIEQYYSNIYLMSKTKDQTYLDPWLDISIFRAIRTNMHMEICGIYLHFGINETRKRKEQRLIFKLGTLAPNGINERFSFA